MLCPIATVGGYAMPDTLTDLRDDTRAGAARGASLVERAQALAPRIAAAHHDIDRDREIPARVLSAMHDARLFAMLLPRSIGGEEVHPETLFHVMETIARADASTAWCLGQNCGVSMAAAYLDRSVASEIFTSGRTTAAHGAGSARAIVVDGGYRVTGHWRFASGSRHSSWLGGHATVCDADGKPYLGSDGSPLEPRTMFFPTSKAKIIDTWQVMGLRGTGSDDYAVEDLFVPSAYSYTREAAAERRESGPLYRISIYNMFGIMFSAVGIGVAQAMLDDLLSIAKTKTPHLQKNPLAQSTHIQIEVGKAHARLGAARAYVLDHFRRQHDRAAAGQAVTDQDRIVGLTVTCFAINLAREAGDFAYSAAGATAIFDRNPFERRFRDLHTVTQQLQAHVAHYEALGQSLLG